MVTGPRPFYSTGGKFSITPLKQTLCSESRLWIQSKWIRKKAAPKKHKLVTNTKTSFWCQYTKNNDKPGTQKPAQFTPSAPDHVTTCYRVRAATLDTYRGVWFRSLVPWVLVLPVFLSSVTERPKIDYANHETPSSVKAQCDRIQISVPVMATTLYHPKITNTS